MNILKVLAKQNHLSLAFSLMLGLLLAGNLQAQSWIDPENSKVSRVVYDSKAEAQQWLLPQGPIERIDGLWQPEQSRQLEGKLRRRTLEFGAENSEAGLFKEYEQLLKKQGAQLLFSCLGRDCGQSNNWANRFFNIYQLYGREDSQRLSSYFWQSGGQDHFALLYLVRRGNQRIYLQQELLSLTSDLAGTAVLPSKEQVWKQWQSTGLLRLSQSTGQLDQQGTLLPAWLKLISELMREHPKARLDVVGHSYALPGSRPGAGPAAKAEAEAMLETLKAGLLSEGVSQGRITLHNLENLAPLNSRLEGARLDLLLHK
ncbi:DUF4892 domain-containing protein [uncultured Pseudoteredinibacter sp.]|uniref:DUF4892 domain-containing protein n=1 Tax=uncultured Pseudoteredinibacter sp. TaxID=1641701 RepID=UPI00261453BA|nr:DUF4892 domain-containing protein [uncultured Pseudoteredinibacter sp.]